MPRFDLAAFLNLWYAVVAGGLITFLVARHYFRKQTRQFEVTAKFWEKLARKLYPGESGRPVFIRDDERIVDAGERVVAQRRVPYEHLGPHGEATRIQIRLAREGAWHGAWGLIDGRFKLEGPAGREVRFDQEIWFRPANQDGSGARRRVVDVERHDGVHEWVALALE